MDTGHRWTFKKKKKSELIVKYCRNTAAFFKYLTLSIMSLPLLELILGVLLHFPSSSLLFSPSSYRIYIFDSEARGCQSFYQSKACLFNSVNSKPRTLT